MLPGRPDTPTPPVGLAEAGGRVKLAANPFLINSRLLAASEGCLEGLLIAEPAGRET